MSKSAGGEGVETGDARDCDPRLAGAFRLFTGYWLVGWFIKTWFYGVYLFQVIESVRWSFDFFPAFFQSPAVACFLYVLPMSALGAFFTRRLSVFRAFAFVMVTSSAILAVHQDTHNDATFVTSFWAGLWALWLVSEGARAAESLAVHAKALVALVVGMIFAGGFVGKLTPQYWNGVILANIFGSYEAGILVEWIKHSQSQDMQVILFRWLARALVFCEGFLALSPLFPYSFLLFGGVPLLLGFALTNSVWIYSVLMCILGMILSARRL